MAGLDPESRWDGRWGWHGEGPGEDGKEGWVVEASRRVPGCERAVVVEGKLTGYLLDPEHPDGGAKARALAATLGYGPGDAGRLRVELLRVVAEQPFSGMRPARQPPGALAYTLEGLIGGPNGRRAPIRTVWQVDALGQAPYLITAYLIGLAVPEEPLQ